MPKSQPLRADEKVVKVIRELAVMPPPKAMAEVKAASDVFEANAKPGSAGKESASSDRKKKVDKDG